MGMALEIELKGKMNESLEHFVIIGKSLLIPLFPNLREYAKNCLVQYSVDNEEIDFAFQFIYLPSDDISFEYFQNEILQQLTYLQNIGKKVNTFYCFIAPYVKNGNRLKEFPNLLFDNINIEEVVFGDINFFYDFIIEQIQVEISSIITEANQRFEQDYIRIMEQRFYFDDVPFETEDKALPTNPLKYIKQKFKLEEFSGLEDLLSSIAMDKNRKPSQPMRPKCFIISEFGFGKTSLLMQLAKESKQLKVTPIYIPVALFSKRGFENIAKFLKELLEKLMDIPLDEGNNYHQLLIRAFKQKLKLRTDIVFLFDGLDEHKQMYRPGGLEQLANLLKDLQSVCLFTVRKEFWDEYHEVFELAFNFKRKKFYKILLTEWQLSTISNYLNQYLAQTSNVKSLQDFKQLIDKDNYEVYYGDIPKRPLFLQMLVQDIESGEVIKKNLAELYSDYFNQKFYLGRYGLDSVTPTGRPFATFDNQNPLSWLFRLTEDIAYNMLEVNEKKHIVYTNQVSLNDLTLVLKQYNLTDMNVVLQHSVLVTYDKNISVETKVKFAHKSFHEYFAARFFFRKLIKPVWDSALSAWINEYACSYGMFTFIKNMFEIADEQDKYNFINNLQQLLYLDGSETLYSRLKEVLKFKITTNKEYTTQKMKHKVFISYNHDDNVVALAAKKALEVAGIEVVIDLENLLAGDNIKEFLEKSIKDCDVTLSIVSERSLKSTWVAMESINTFYAEKFADKKFMAAFIDGHFFQRSYVNDTLDEIEKEVKEIQAEIQRSLNKNRPIVHLQNELTRNQDLNHNLSKIVERLKESFSVDISGNKFEEGMTSIIKSIKQIPLANENKTDSQSNINVSGNNNTVISGVSESNINVNTTSANPNPPINSTAEEMCQLIDKDLDLAFGRLDVHFKDNPGYHDLCDIYIHRPGNFTLNDFRSRLKVFIRKNIQ